MSISDVASMVGGAFLGAPVSEILKLVIEEAKKVKDFKPLSQDLASTMERLVPRFKEVDSMQQRCNGDLIALIKTLERAEKMVSKCSGVKWYSISKKALYTREIKEINQEFLKFCQIELQLIQHRNQLQSMQSMASVTMNIDLLKEFATNFPPCICHGCNSVTEHGRLEPISSIDEVENHVSNSRGKLHKSYYMDYCYVCKDIIISTAQRIEFNEHPFWLEKYCACHDIDGTPKCCSCERLEPKETNYVMLGDGRWICLECNESSIMDTYECQPLHYEIREFFKGLNMEIEKQFPLVLVEKQALNTAEEEDKIGHHHEVSTRGCCFSEEVIITSVLRRPKMQSNNMLIEEIENVRTVGESKIILVMILYGLPRLVTGSILAHEMMHAWLRINGYRDLEPDVEEGLCQVVAHMWLESQTYASTNGAAASSSASSSSSHMRVNTTNEPMFEEKLVEFCKNHIEKDDSPLYGLGFKRVHEMVTNSSLHQTLRGFPSRKLKTERQVQILESNRRTFSNFKGS
ncbi:Powdery mildew resistance protein RPW8 domain [Arabidopsis suecica]|uniref:Powdery mildew resistance protein RPW8 domain n=1 Tax=Arabidopsis suecica TaxID=45249 RepID=A0A8T2CL53_ARASU|nr:Powdery mildew resistance protein RPW8 domain [Arabidopsis suecica]